MDDERQQPDPEEEQLPQDPESEPDLPEPEPPEPDQPEEDDGEDEEQPPQRPEFLLPEFQTAEEQARVLGERARAAEQQARQTAPPPTAPEQPLTAEALYRYAAEQDPMLLDQREILTEMQELADQAAEEYGRDSLDYRRQAVQLKAQQHIVRQREAEIQNMAFHTARQHAAAEVDGILSRQEQRLASDPRGVSFAQAAKAAAQERVTELMESNLLSPEHLRDVPWLAQELADAAAYRVAQQMGDLPAEDEPPAPPRLETGRGAPGRVDPKTARMARDLGMTPEEYRKFSDPKFTYSSARRE